MAIISKSALAAELSVTKARVSQYVKRGLPVRSDGKLNRDEALNWLSLNAMARLNSDKGPERARNLAARTPKKPSPEASLFRTPEQDIFGGSAMDAARMATAVELIALCEPMSAERMLEAGVPIEKAFTLAEIIRAELHVIAECYFERLAMPDFSNENWHENWVPPALIRQPNWQALAAKVGERHDIEAWEQAREKHPFYHETELVDWRARLASTSAAAN